MLKVMRLTFFRAGILPTRRASVNQTSDADLIRSWN
jgi:hypothetical protein